MAEKNNLPVPLRGMPPALAVRLSRAPHDLANLASAYMVGAVSRGDTNRVARERIIANFCDYIRTYYDVASPQLEHLSIAVCRDFYLSRLLAVDKKGYRTFSDRTVVTYLQYLKAFVRWLLLLFPGEFLDDPSADIRHAVDPAPPPFIDVAGRRLLNNAAKRQELKSRRRNPRRFGDVPPAQAPVHAQSRPARNEAMIAALNGTGCRRAEVVGILLKHVDFKKKKILVQVKGRRMHTYRCTESALRVIRRYIETERPADAAFWEVDYLFLTARTVNRGTGQMSAGQFNRIFKSIAADAGVEGTPHGVRRGVGKSLVEKTGNPTVAQIQLGHRSPTTTLSFYSPATDAELADAVEEID